MATADVRAILLYYLTGCVPVRNLRDLDLDVIPSLGVRNEDNESLNPGYAFAAPADLLDVDLVLLALLYGLGTEV